MYPDGVCRVTDNYYTKTVQFQDINYQLNQNEDKTAIFDGWCDFLNYFDSSIRFQLSFINLSATRDTYARRIAIPLQGDCFDKLRTEYTGMLQSQLARGNNGLIKTKYLTFGVEADSLRAAKPRLERIETDILNNFRRLGVTAESLNGMERLRLLLRTGCRRDCYCNAQTGRSLAVTPDGRLWPCSALAGAEGCLLGTLGAGTALPQSPCPGLEPPEECARCPAFGLCGGGCPAARRAGPSPLDCQMHRRMLEHACRLEGKLEWWNTWKTAFPDREEPDDKEESQ